ncbi:hypothetical protein KFE25_003912 [Diacronema lutheri]|uniref:Uncharacterized protein n=1 Tax=Diacronema lutheri TaxID=2081491 RepID=A0A8J5XNB6_DIALT|nr:hypothetical protein KFE25_003912 [Diacronema lutheri]
MFESLVLPPMAGLFFRSAAAPPPAPPPPPELSANVHGSVALVLAVSVLLAVSALSGREVWHPFPPHHVYLAEMAWRSYGSALKSHPRSTSAVSGACISALGNWIGTGALGASTCRFALWGALVSFISSWWVRALNRAFDGRTSRWLVLEKTLVDQMVSVPFFTALFQLVHGTLQGLPPAEIYARLRAGYLVACLAAWRFWPPVVLLAYAYVPQQLTVVFFSSAGLVWNVILTLMHSSSR